VGQVPDLPAEVPPPTRRARHGQMTPRFFAHAVPNHETNPTEPHESASGAGSRPARRSAAAHAARPTRRPPEPVPGITKRTQGRPIWCA